MLPTFKNQHFTFDLTQIQVVSFQCNHIFLFKTTRSSNMASDYPNICWFLLTFSILQYLIGFIFFISQCSNSFGIYVLLNHTSVDWFPSLVVLHLHITFILRIPGESQNIICSNKICCLPSDSLFSHKCSDDKTNTIPFILIKNEIPIILYSIS